MRALLSHSGGGVDSPTEPSVKFHPSIEYVPFLIHPTAIMSNILTHYGLPDVYASGPELSGAQSAFKNILTCANLIFLIFGCVLCGVGGYAIGTEAGALAGQTLPQGIIVLGVFIILMSFLGCVSAYKESRLFLGVYFIFLLLFVIILGSIGIAVHVKKDNAPQYIEEGWCSALEDADTSLILQDVQSHFLCCGLQSFNDSLASGIPGEDNFVPAACPQNMQRKNPHYVPCPAGLTKAIGQPCMPILESTFEHSYVTAGACAIAFAVIMAVFMVFVCVLMSGIKEKRHMEDMRKLHRKLRDLKDNPSMRARGLEEMYGEVDLGEGFGGSPMPGPASSASQHDPSSVSASVGTATVPAAAGGGMEAELDTQQVDVHVDESEEDVETGGSQQSAATTRSSRKGGAASSSSSRGKKSNTGRRVQEQGYEIEEEQQQQTQHPHRPTPGYAPHPRDEYDEEEQ